MPIAAAEETEPQSAWTALSSMATPRGAFGLAVVAGRIYVIGGIDSNNVPLGTMEEYNPATNQWITKASMPTPRSGFAVAVMDNKIYAIGGSIGNGYLGNNEVYDPTTDRWETKTSMPTPRTNLTASTINGEIYLVGGEKYSNVYPFYGETGINEAYDPANDSWTTKTSLPTAVQGYASAVIGNQIYIVGGSRHPSAMSSAILVSNNQVYDTQTDSWNESTRLPFAAGYGAAVATTGYLAPQYIYFLGGFLENAVSQKTLMFNPTNQTWREGEAMPTPREYLQAAVINDVIYVIGGYDGTQWLNTNEQYKPEGYGTIAPIIEITSPENKTYTEVPVAFNLNRGVVWTGYSLDDGANVTLKTLPTTLSGLSQGAHTIVLYTNDSNGNMGVSNTVYFSVDTLAPSLNILSPANQSYGSTDIQLTFILNEAAKNLTYSLDGGDKINIEGNVTLPALANGAHHITVYASDDMGNASQETVYFNISPFPFLTVVASILIVIIAVASGYLFFVRPKPGKEKQPDS